MENIVHIQQVLQLLSESESPCTEAELILTLKHKFGNDMKIATCSDALLMPDEVKAFMLEKGKIYIDNDLIFFMHGHRC